MTYQYFSISVRHLCEMVINPRLYRELTNWSDLVLDYLGLQNKKLLDIKLRDGNKITIRGHSDDKWPIHEVIIRDDYHLDDLKPNLKNIIDLGAGLGDFSVQVARLNPDAKIIALEPSPNNFKLLLENIRQNEYQRRIIPFRLACAHKRGMLKFYITSNYGGHSLNKRKSKQQLKVQTITLQDVMKKAGFISCDLLKLDIEGAEYELLYKFSKKYFKKFSIISMEYHNLDKKRLNGNMLSRYLESQGYIVEYKDSFNKTVGQLFARKH